MKKALPFILTAVAIIGINFLLLASATVRPVDANNKPIEGQRMKIGWGKGKKK
jgi:hypothetical protein